MTIGHTDITYHPEGDVRASVAIRKLACIVRKLPPKRKLISPPFHAENRQGLEVVV